MYLDEVVGWLRRSRGSWATQILQELIPHCTFVKIQNVADLYFASSAYDDWTCHDFPCLVPPWPLAWFEWKVPLVLRYRGKDIATPNFSQKSCGALVSVTDFDPPPMKRTPRWGLEFHYFGIHPCEPFLLTQHILLWSDGTIVRDAFGANLPYQYRLDGCCGGPKVKYEMSGLYFDGPLFLALSLANCKNVVAAKTDLESRLVKRRMIRGRLPVSSYYTLEIEPMRKVLMDIESKNPGMSLVRRLHLCRGHFKDFRSGGGLFGKHKGLFWWDQYARGDPRAGEIRKDYEIAPPENTDPSEG